MSRSMIRFFGAIACAAVSGCFAAATVQAAQPYDWTGFYVGGNVGGLDLQTDYNVTLPSPLSSFTASRSGSGIVGGIFGGYMYQFHTTPIVVGIEADFQGANASNSFSQVQTFGTEVPTTCTITGDSALDWQSSVRGRVGYALGRFQPYVTGGVQFGEFDLDNSFGCVSRQTAPVSTLSASNSALLTGWTVGLGLDYAATNSIMIQVEYRHEDFGETTEGFGGGFPGTVTFDPTADMITVGAAWHF